MTHWRNGQCGLAILLLQASLRVTWRQSVAHEGLRNWGREAAKASGWRAMEWLCRSQANKKGTLHGVPLFFGLEESVVALAHLLVEADGERQGDGHAEDACDTAQPR